MWPDDAILRLCIMLHSSELHLSGAGEEGSLEKAGI